MTADSAVPPTTDSDDRELTFVFEITTTLGAGDEVNPTMRYVGDWLNDNDYGYRQIGDARVVHGITEGANHDH